MAVGQSCASTMTSTPLAYKHGCVLTRATITATTMIGRVEAIRPAVI